MVGPDGRPAAAGAGIICLRHDRLRLGLCLSYRAGVHPLRAAADPGEQLDLFDPVCQHSRDDQHDGSRVGGIDLVDGAGALFGILGAGAGGDRALSGDRAVDDAGLWDCRGGKPHLLLPVFLLCGEDAEIVGAACRCAGFPAVAEADRHPISSSASSPCRCCSACSG